MDIHDLQPNDVLGAYRIIRPLGQGGMGSVYEAEHVRLGSRRALKVFASDSEYAEFLGKRFLAEGRILAELDHPKIVRVYDFAVDGATKTPYFAMDLVLSPSGEPRTLDDECESGAVTEDKVEQWFSDICDGLGYIHSKGIVHRDVSLDNVLIGPDGHVVLTDFGVARITAESTRRKVMVTRTMVAKDGSGLSIGKDLYMAPELKNGGGATPASDAYSLGVLIFRLLAGSWYTPETRLEDALAAFDPKWVGIVRQLCSKDPKNRLPLMLDDVRIECPKCGKVLQWKGKIPDGQHIRCPICGCRFEVVDDEIRILPDKVKPATKQFSDTMSIPSFPSDKTMPGAASGPSGSGDAVKTVCRYALAAVAIITVGVVALQFKDGGKPAPVIGHEDAASAKQDDMQKIAEGYCFKADLLMVDLQGLSGEHGVDKKINEIKKYQATIKHYKEQKKYENIPGVFSQLEKMVNNVLEYHKERRRTYDVLEELKKVSACADTEDNKVYATAVWNSAVESFEDGLYEYDRGQFSSACKSFQNAKGDFERCPEVAQSNKLAIRQREEQMSREERDYGRAVEKVGKVEAELVAKMNWTQAKSDMDSFARTLSGEKARRVVDLEINRIARMQGFRSWCKKNLPSKKFRYGKTEAEWVKIGETELHFQYHAIAQKGRDVWKPQSCSWEDFFGNENAMLDQVLGFISSDAKGKFPSDEARSDCLVGGVLVADQCQNGDAEWTKKIGGYVKKAVAISPGNRQYFKKWYDDDEQEEREARVMPEPTLVAKKLPDFRKLEEPDFGIPIHVKTRSEAGVKSACKGAERGNVKFEWTSSNDKVCIKDDKNIAFDLMFVQDEKGFRLVKGPYETDGQVIKIGYDENRMDLPDKNYQMTKRELDKWQYADSFSLDVGNVFLVQVPSGCMMGLKIESIARRVDGAESDLIGFIYQIYERSTL